MAERDEHPRRRRSDRHEAAHEQRRQPTHLHWTPEDDEETHRGGRFGSTTIYQERNPDYHPIRSWLAALWGAFHGRR